MGLICKWMAQLGCAICLLALGAGTSVAAQFEIRENSITLYGALDIADAAELKRHLDTIPYGEAVVVLRSKGGTGEAGFRLGHVIREAGADTRVLGKCNSACVFAFIGGVERVSNGATLGFHKPRTASGVALPNDSYFYETIADYADDMGVDGQRFIDWMRAHPAGKMIFPHPDELCAAKLLTQCRLTN